MKTALFLFIATFALLTPLPLLAEICGDACTVDANCAGGPCAYCNTEYGICANCCEYTEAITCPGGCSWIASECRNEASTVCPAVSETPKNFRYLFFLLAFIGILGFSYWAARRAKANGNLPR